jgi:hypothetical protein
MPRNRLLIWPHTFYERLCAKVAYGDASDAEFGELIKHLQTCTECRALLRDFIRITADVLPQIAAGHSRTGFLGANGYKVTRDSKGMGEAHFQGTKKLRRFRWPLSLACGAALLLSAVLVARHVRVRGYDHSTPAPMAEVRSIAELNRRRERDLSAGASEREALQAAQLQVTKLKAALKVVDASTAAAEKKNSELEARIVNYENALADSERIVQEKTLVAVRLKQEIAEQEQVLNSKATELASVRGRLVDIEGELDHQREVNSALAKAQELIAARDFHLISVPAMDPDTGHPRPFGRILYAEGKEMMFYAFNLDGSGELASANFHVWGDKAGSAGSTRSLGVFKSDDKAAGRWRLIFSDANVLANLDRIFVTVELSTEAVKKPKGKKILIAYLGEKPNHP